MASLLQFSGRVALVAGSGSGVGRAVCQVLAREGASVIAADINGDAAHETLALLSGGEGAHMAVQCDVSKRESVTKCFETATAKLAKPVSLLANTAGITRDAFMTKMTDANFDAVIDVNLKGTFLLTQIFAHSLTAMGKEGEDPLPGSVVNFSSIVAKEGNAGQCQYAASKAGVEAFTRTMGRELARKNIRVNCIVPGIIDTPMISTLPDHIRANMLYFIPMNRLGQPEEVAEVVSFLLSDKASYVNGTCVEVSGGMNSIP